MSIAALAVRSDGLTVFSPPRARPLAGVAAERARALGSPPALQVLLVEDSASDAGLLEVALADTSGEDGPTFVVRRVDRLAEGCRVLAAAGADVVLLDLSLPDAEGLEALTAVLGAAPDVPVVVVTGLADDGVALAAVRAGAQDYLVKGREDARAVRRALRYAVERQALMRVARDATRVRDEMLAVVSHDLRNPLGTIHMCAQALLDEGIVAPSGWRQMLEIIQRSGRWMNGLIQDLLDATRLEAGQLAVHAEPTPPAAIVATLVAMHGAAAEAAGLTLVTEVAADAPAVRADADRLVQALGNLLANAVKFTPAGGRITVAVDAPAGAGTVRFAVRDTGRGIDPAHLPHVFDRYWQARAARRSGAGLGLAIAKGIVDAHGGTIAVASVPGAGTTFTCTLPAAPA